jgi:hypothetical protein
MMEEFAEQGRLIGRPEMDPFQGFVAHKVRKAVYRMQSTRWVKHMITLRTVQLQMRTTQGLVVGIDQNQDLRMDAPVDSIVQNLLQNPLATKPMREQQLEIDAAPLRVARTKQGPRLYFRKGGMMGWCASHHLSASHHLKG